MSDTDQERDENAHQARLTTAAHKHDEDHTGAPLLCPVPSCPWGVVA